MVKTSLTSRAAQNPYRKTIDAAWHSGTTSTENSTAIQILSDLVSSTYDFLLTGETANLLQALSNMKNSKHKANTRVLIADEFTEVPKYRLMLKIGIRFSADKKSVNLILYARSSYGKTCMVHTLSSLTKARLAYITNVLSEVEEIYKTL